MDQSEQHAPDEKSHRLSQRIEPKRLQDRRSACVSEEGLSDHINHIAEESAEHNSPESRADTAPHEHIQHLLHAFTHTRAFLQNYEASDRHHKSVSGIGKHHTEEEAIEDRH